MKLTFAVGVLLTASAAFGCSAGQPAAAPAPVVATVYRLPFKGRLSEGDPSEVPPAVAMSLSSDSPVVFSYREELSHDEYHIPLYLTALDPVTLLGAPLGDFGVTAFASLSITKGYYVREYTARAYVSKSYTLYSEPTHKELEDAARLEVRDRIDEQLYRDAAQLADALAAAPKPQRDSPDK